MRRGAHKTFGLFSCSSLSSKRLINGIFGKIFQQNARARAVHKTFGLFSSSSLSSNVQLEISKHLAFSLDLACQYNFKSTLIKGLGYLHRKERRFTSIQLTRDLEKIFDKNKTTGNLRSLRIIRIWKGFLSKLEFSRVPQESKNWYFFRRPKAGFVDDF